MNQVRLLLVIADSSQTGAPRQVLLLANALANSYELHLACPNGWLAKTINKKITLHELIEPGSGRSLANQLQTIYQTVNPTLIHLHGTRAGIAGRLAKRPPTSRSLYTEHLWTADFKLASPIRQAFKLSLLRYLAPKTDRTIAVSEAVRKFLLAKKLSKAETTSLIYGAIEPIGRQKPIGQPVIGSLGTINSVKGIDILLKALPTVKDEFPNLKCRLGGQMAKALNNTLPDLVDKLDLNDQVEWLGEVTDPAAFYHSLSIYVQPSRSESFGMTPLEAMSAGIPTIAAATGALPEVIGQDNGLFFSQEDCQGLAEQLLRLLADQRLYDTLVQKGQERASYFSVQRMVAAHQTVYQNLLEESLTATRAQSGKGR